MGGRLEGWMHGRDSRPSFETRRKDAALLRMRSESFHVLSVQLGFEIADALGDERFGRSTMGRLDSYRLAGFRLVDEIDHRGPSAVNRSLDGSCGGGL